ncbi:FecR domain-containing protein [Kerstersia similis]|uniref:FecR domain-containing protein n=1 Tax=Kerstersia similis TaxID=206505 RepID=UPI0039EDFEFB
MASDSDIDPRILNEAAAWLARFDEGALSADESASLRTWQQRSPQHAEAWSRVQALMAIFNQIPAQVQPQILPAMALSRTQGRRRMMRGLGMLALAAPLGWLSYRYQADGLAGGPLQPVSDLHTRLGEVSEQRLDDGSLLVMNTGTAVDVRFTTQERRIRLLSGEIFLESARQPDPMQRPLLVETREGTARALGTGYTVRQHDGQTEVAVHEGKVALRRHGETRDFTVLMPGQGLRFGQHGAPGAVRPASSDDLMWRHGLLVANGMRLDTLLTELGRYRPGLLQVQPDIAGLRASGSFSLRDTDASLALLADTLQLQITRRTRYWIILGRG